MALLFRHPGAPPTGRFTAADAVRSGNTMGNQLTNVLAMRAWKSSVVFSKT